MYCQLDSYKKHIQTEVLECIPLRGRWGVVLSDNLLYPEGGGQPSDRGWIDDTMVMDVQKHEGKVYAIVDVPIEKTTVNLKLDWTRRFAHMQLHTGQHLLTALILKNYGWMTVGFHINADVATIDLDTSSVSEAQCREIEELVNSYILQSLPVCDHLVSREKFEELNIRSRGVPDWVEGPIRLIEIAGVDINNCGGTHLRNTAELMMFAIVKKEKMKTKTRIHFVYGDRLLNRFRNYMAKEKSLNEIFQDGAHIERAQEWARDRKEHKRERKKWQAESARQEGLRLAAKHKKWNLEYRKGWDLGMIKNTLRIAVEKSSRANFLLYSELVFAGVIHNHETYNTILQSIRSMGGKGGGKPPMFQGKWTAQVDLSTLHATLASQLQ